MRPTAARRGEVTLESTASELLSAIINIVQNMWNVDDVDPDLFLGLASWVAGARRSPRSARGRARRTQPGMLEELYEMIIEANRWRASQILDRERDGVGNGDHRDRSAGRERRL